MALLTILSETESLNNDLLHRCADHVTRVDEYISNISADMFETMKNASGIGLAATQVGAFKRIFVMDTERLLNISNGNDITYFSVYKSEIGNVFINPNITKFSKEKSNMMEGCLSVSGVADNVKGTYIIARPATIEAEYFDKDWKYQTFTLTGLTAKCFQHELDHLNGITLLNRIDEEKEWQYDLL